MKTITLNATVTASNDKDAEALRLRLREAGTLLVNVMSSPGAGKTTLLSRLIQDLKNVKIASICSKDGKEAAVAHPALLAKRVPEFEWLTVHPAYCPSRTK